MNERLKNTVDEFRDIKCKIDQQKTNNTMLNKIKTMRSIIWSRREKEDIKWITIQENSKNRMSHYITLKGF